MPKETITFEWESITIEASFDPNWPLCQHHDFAIAHLEVRAISPERAPLPMTETGYKSHFMQVEEIEAQGGVEPYVRAWLEHAAKSQEWQSHIAETRQLSFF